MKTAVWASDEDRRALILSPSTVNPGGWRLTHWDDIGPSAHTEHATIRDAIAEKRDFAGPWVGNPEWNIDPRPSAYSRRSDAPSWLGLRVVTGGVEWQPSLTES